MINFINVVKEYPTHKVGPLNFEVEEGGIYSIIGQSGAGKSTLIKMIFQSISDYKGRILINGEKIDKNKISYITQKPMLFNHLTINENFKLLDLDLTHIDKILKKLKLEENIKDKYPFEISGGQAQRINFVRILLQKPEIILLDEAFSALDVSVKKDIYGLLKAIVISRKVTVFLVTHNLEEAALLSNQIIVMNNGQIKQITTVPKNKKRR